MQAPHGWWGRYEERMQRVVAHVYAHLDEPLDLMTLADIAGMSAFHWHRVFQSMYGESLAGTVKRLRLHRAAGVLANSSLPVEQVALSAGYPNVSSFTRIFKSTYGMPPARYREHGAHASFKIERHASDVEDKAVFVRQLPTMRVIAVPHRGSYMHIGQAFDQLFGRLASKGMARPGMRTLALFHDDPSVVAEGDLRSQACAQGCAHSPLEEPLQLLDVAGGSYAVLTHIGPYASMKAAYEWLFGHWLVNSGYEPADGPVIEEYLNSPRETSPRDLRTDICVPLKPSVDKLDGT